MSRKAEFLASLPAPLSRKGPMFANDATLAKTIRTELSAAVRAGLLPDDTKFSVRINHHSSLTVEIVEWHGGAVLSDEYTVSLMDPTAKWEPEYRMGRRMRDARYSDTLNEALSFVESLADRHNYDDSDSMTDHFDVGYYLTVSADRIASAAEQATKEESDPRHAALRASAREAARRLGPKVVRSICGRGGVDSCGEYSLARLVKMDERANGRPMAYDRRRGWVVQASEGAS